MARLRPVLLPLETARVTELPGAVALRHRKRGTGAVGRGGGPQVQPSEDGADALPVPSRNRGARDRNTGDAADGAGLPGGSGHRLSGPAVHARYRPNRRARGTRRWASELLPAARGLEHLADRAGGSGRPMYHRTPRLRLAAAVGA